MQKLKPVISVLVITYNHAEYIAGCIDGILKQSGEFDIELVISNDASTDATHEIIARSLIAIPGNFIVKYFNQAQNLGIVPNLNFALGQCTGQYIAICEGDDFWTDNQKLQKQLNIFDIEKKCTMVISNRVVMNNDGSAYEERYEDYHQKTLFTDDDILRGFIPGTQTMMFVNSSSVINFLRRNADLTHADRYLAYISSIEGEIRLLPEITAVYRLTGEGAWSKNNRLQKLQVKAAQLEDFHQRINMTIPNSILSENTLRCSYLTLRYCIKRPLEFLKKANRFWVKKLFYNYPEMNKVRFILKLQCNKMKQ